jgi:hypothetical protein
VPTTNYVFLRKPTSLVLIGVAFLAAFSFSMLTATFNYPDILDQSTAEVLSGFELAKAKNVVLYWYLFTLSALGLSVIAFLVSEDRRAAGHLSTLQRATALVGIAAGFVQAVGLSRWVFLVPELSLRYAAAENETLRQAIEVQFATYHAFFGGGLGEHFGFALTATWTMLWSWDIERTPLPKSTKWIARAGWPLSIGILLGCLRVALPNQMAWLLDINALAYSLWLLWLIALGVNGLMRRSLSEGQLKRAAIGVASVWLVSTSQPAKCDSLHLNLFRNPSIGPEYRHESWSIHTGAYTTILEDTPRKSDQDGFEDTWFVRTGVSYWPWQFVYISASHLFALSADRKGNHFGIYETGVEYIAWQSVSFRLGVSVIPAAHGFATKVRPNPGIGWVLEL